MIHHGQYLDSVQFSAQYQASFLDMLPDLHLDILPSTQPVIFELVVQTDFRPTEVWSCKLIFRYKGRGK